MGLLRKERQSNEIDITKIRGKLKVQIEEHKGKHGGEYYVLNVIFKNGTKIIIDMQLVELLSSKLHGYIRKKDAKVVSPGMDMMDDLIEMVSGDEIRDAILKSIYD